MKWRGFKDLPVAINELGCWRMPVNVWGSRLVPPTLDRLVSLQAHRFNWMGRDEKEFLAKLLSPDSVVADVGANQGLYSLWFARSVPQGQVYAFEPDPILFQSLAANLQANRLQNVTAIEAAVSSKSGNLSLSKGWLNRGDNRASVQQTAANGVQVVQAVTIDEVVKSGRLDLLKIDVQGFELQVLLGAQQTIASNPGITILLEFWPYGLRMAGSEPAELLDFLKKAGLTVRGLDPAVTKKLETGELSSWQTALQYCNIVAAQRKD